VTNDAGTRSGRVELDLTTEKIVRINKAKFDSSVGESPLLPATAVADRPRLRSCRLWPYLKQTAIDTSDAAANCTDGGDIISGDLQWQLLLLRLIFECR
jgi:hypothetical protein